MNKIYCCWCMNWLNRICQTNCNYKYFCFSSISPFNFYERHSCWVNFKKHLQYHKKNTEKNLPSSWLGKLSANSLVPFKYSTSKLKSFLPSSSVKTWERNWELYQGNVTSGAVSLSLCTFCRERTTAELTNSISRTNQTFPWDVGVSPSKTGTPFKDKTSES